MSGTATNGVDYQTLNGTITIGGGQTSATLTVIPIDDILVEGTETVVLTLSADAAYSVGSPASATITLIDNDAAGGPAIAATPDPVAIGGTETATFAGVPSPTITDWIGLYEASQVVDTSFYVNWVYANSCTQTAGSGAVASNTCTIAMPISPRPTNTFNLRLFTSGSYNKIATSNQFIMGSSGPTVSVVATDASADELGDPGIFTLTRTGSTASSLTVNYTMGGTATNGTDYVTLPGTATIAGGSTTTTVTLSPVNDSLAEGSETAVMTITAGTGYSVGFPSSATVTIIDNGNGAGIGDDGVHESVSSIPVDPAGLGNSGFARDHWISSINKMLHPFGSGPSSGNNSLYGYDPVTKAWTTLFTADAVNAPQKRDNHGSFYVPALNEYWIWAGSHLDALAVQFAGAVGTVIAGPTSSVSKTWYNVTFPTGPSGWIPTTNEGGATSVVVVGSVATVQTGLSTFVYDAVPAVSDLSDVNLVGVKSGGRFSFTTNTWVETGGTKRGGTGYVEGFTGVLTGGMPYTGTDPGTAWSEVGDMGMICCGSGGGNPTNATFLIERDIGGAKRYKVTTLSGNPPARDQMMNALVAVGPDFYLYSGRVQSGSPLIEDTTGDLWKWTVSDRAWHQLANPPRVVHPLNPFGAPNLQVAMTYDIVQNALVVWTYNKLQYYSIAANTWRDITPPGLACVFNATAVYAPNVKLHLYMGGNDCSQAGDPGASDNHRAIRMFSPPPQTWVAVPYSTVPAGAPGNGGVGGAYGGKHMNLQINTDNGRMYITGGDSELVSYGDNQGVWSYHIPTNSWRNDYPHCGIDGDIMPGGANESGWVYVPEQKKFVLQPGFWFLTQSGPSNQCGGAVTWPSTAVPMVITGQLYQAFNVTGGNANRFYESLGITIQRDTPSTGQQTLTASGVNSEGVSVASTGAPLTVWYQPPGGAYQVIQDLVFDSETTNKWSASPSWPCRTLFNGTCAGTGGDHSQAPKNAVYDPVTKKIFRVGTDGRGVAWYVYDLSAWPTITSYSFGTFVPNSGDMQFEWITIDIEGRKIYGMDPLNYDLYELDITAAQSCAHGPNCPTVLTKKAKPPKPPNGPFSQYVDVVSSTANTVTLSGDQTSVAITGKPIFARDVSIRDTSGNYIQTNVPTSAVFSGGNTTVTFSGAALPNLTGGSYFLYPAMTNKAGSSCAPDLPADASAWQGGGLQDFTQLAFDSVNRILFYPWICSLGHSRPTLFIYNPLVNTWAIDPMFQPEGKTVRGNHFKFDSINNVLMTFGGLCRADTTSECAGAGNHDPSLTDFFIYRYQ
jgi:hypothetical protein